MKKKTRKKLWQYSHKRNWFRLGSVTTGVCDDCNNQLFYFYDYDAICCPRCNIWKEPKCDDPRCDYCKNRPDSPNIGLFELKENSSKINPKFYYANKYAKRLKGYNQKNNTITYYLQTYNREN